MYLYGPLCYTHFKTVLRIRIRMDLNHFGNLVPGPNQVESCIRIRIKVKQDPDPHQREKLGLRGPFWSIGESKSGEKGAVGSGSAWKWKVGSGSAWEWKVGSGSASKWKAVSGSTSKWGGFETQLNISKCIFTLTSSLLLLFGFLGRTVCG